MAEYLDALSSTKTGSASDTFYSRLYVMQYGRRPFVTSKARFGIGHQNVQKGDILCVFDGAIKPHIIRSTIIPEEKTLLSEAYVLGMMNGEVHSLGLQEDIVLV